jgi:hypothetical protein
LTAIPRRTTTNAIIGAAAIWRTKTEHCSTNHRNASADVTRKMLTKCHRTITNEFESRIRIR